MSLSKKKSVESIEVEPNQLPKPIPHKRIQTAEGWKRSQMKLRKPSKPVSKS